MKYLNYNDVPAEKIKNKEVKDISIRWLISKQDGARNFAMRLFEVGPGGYSPYHQHDWEHEMFIVEGEGYAKTETGDIKFKAGDVFYIEPREWHNFNNTGNKPLKFLCLIPNIQKDKK